jgi:uncharacterized membrane protein
MTMVDLLLLEVVVVVLLLDETQSAQDLQLLVEMNIEEGAFAMSLLDSLS